MQKQNIVLEHRYRDRINCNGIPLVFLLVKFKEITLSVLLSGSFGRTYHKCAAEGVWGVWAFLHASTLVIAVLGGVVLLVCAAVPFLFHFQLSLNWLDCGARGSKSL